METQESKSYGWEDNDVFTMKGKDFGLLINNMRAISASPTATIFRTIDKLLPILENMLEESIKNGIVKEIDLSKKDA